MSAEQVVRYRIFLRDLPVNHLRLYRGLRAYGFARADANYILLGYAMATGHHKFTRSNEIPPPATTENQA